MSSAPRSSTPPTAAPSGTDPQAIHELLGSTAGRPWWRRATLWLGLLGLIALLAGGWAWFGHDSRPAGPQFITETLARGTIRLSVTADGKLQPTRSVSIGSELSGTVSRVLVDVNDKVKKGQLLVELDTAKLRDQITRSRAALASAEAAVQQAASAVKAAQLNLQRLQEVQRLSGGQVPSAAELDTARATLDQAVATEASNRAQVTSARAQLSTDETNLAKASIRSPIDGVVLTRAVDPGNAVAASLQAVTLFTIAEDLSKLQLSVSVDEADVGRIAPGQQASFTVSAWPGRRYPAAVTRVAYGSTLTDNVVTYTTLLDVANPDLSLRPGMTATASIAAAERQDVLVVPNSALRFTPSLAGTDATASGAAAASGGSDGSGSILSRLMPRPPGLNRTRRPAGQRPSGEGQQIWILQNGQPVALPVQGGLSDGRRTEISGAGVHEGLAVITEQRSGAGSAP